MRLDTEPRSRRRTLPLTVILALSQLGLARVGLAQSGPPLELTLPQAIDLALKQNRDLQLAQLAVIARQRDKQIARAAYFPQIKNESTVLHITELAGVSVPAGAFGTSVPPGPIPAHHLVIDQGALTGYTSGTGLAQPLTQMFKIRESNRAAAADIDSAKIQVDQAQNEVALKVRQLYYGILIAQIKGQAAAEEVDASQVKLNESTDAVDRGKALEVVALEGRAALLDAKQAVLTQTLQVHDLTVALDDLLGLPLNTRIRPDEDAPAPGIPLPSREECLAIARDRSPEIRAARQAVEKARAHLAAAKDAYIPDITGIARYSYQSGVPLLVHNFGTFGATFTYDLFDGGRRGAEIGESRALLSQAELSLDKAQEEVAVQVETAYDRVAELQNLVAVALEVLQARAEASRVAARQLEQNEVLSSAAAEAAAKASAAKASLLEAKLGLSLARGDLQRAMGQIPRE